MRHYEYFITLYECDYNAIWILNLSKMFPQRLLKVLKPDCLLSVVSSVLENNLTELR